ncbi:hypothetical protein SDC9_80970 [bioreactor metagenome]|uniref:Lipoprotein n=1 Tax=bioreactor metagenome TaxID=1076179 RepID=A0A644Z199_9ZZZZ
MRPPIKLLFFAIVLPLGVLFSCQSEKKIAKGFIISADHPSLYITYSADWQMFFIKPQGALPSESYARRYFPYRSYFLKNEGTAVVDSIFNNSMNRKLSAKGFQLYTDSNVNDFLSDSREKYIVEFVQLYLEEKTMPVRDTLYFTNSSYTKFDTVISRLELCFWLRINPVDDTTLASPLLYASFPLIDYIDGYWEYDLTNNSYFYNYRFTEFGTEDIFSLFENSGKNMAGYIFDYFLNLYLYRHMERIPDAYYSWNGSLLRKAGQERFVFMK